MWVGSFALLTCATKSRMPPGAKNSSRVLALALVDEDDPQALGQERGLAQALDEPFGVPLGLLEDLGVGHEADRRAGVLRRPDRLHLRRRLAARELLAVDLAVALDLGDQALGERVDDRDADAVQAAGDLVAALAELAAGVQLRQDDGQRGQALVLHHVDRDARAVVPDGHRLVRMEGHLDEVAAAGESLVDGVRDHLVHEVVEAPGARRADVHAGPFPDRLEALEDRDVFCGVGCFRQVQKKPCKSHICGRDDSLSERAVGRGGSRGPARPPFATSFAEVFVLDLRGQRGGSRRRLRVRRPRPSVRAPSASGARGLGQLARRKSERFRRVARRALPRSRCEDLAARAGRARTPTRPTSVADVQRPVARDPGGPGVARDHRPDRVGPRPRRSSGIAPGAPNRASSALRPPAPIRSIRLHRAAPA